MYTAIYTYVKYSRIYTVKHLKLILQICLNVTSVSILSTFFYFVETQV